MKKNLYLWILLAFMSFCCNSESPDTLDQIIEDIPEEIIPEKQKEEEEEEEEEEETETNNEQKKLIKILSLGDSYTIGQSVCETCRFPEQLKSNLATTLDDNTALELQVIARTGWTTTSLINAIEDENPNNDFDLVTLLIGVNNQYQGNAFSIYEDDFPKLVNTAIKKAKGKDNHIIVLSIPDYAYTPFGNASTRISDDIDTYNRFAQNYCDLNGITFLNITDITRNGLINKGLVASDGLHPSDLAYSKFVERLLPLALNILK